MNKINDTRPSVHIYEASANPIHLSEICAGLEEEGIPYAIFKASGDAKPLANEAANHSKLRVGIGITTKYAILQIRNSPVDVSQWDISNQDPVLHINLSNPATNTNCRALGTNAARAVKGGVFI